MVFYFICKIALSGKKMATKLISKFAKYHCSSSWGSDQFFIALWVRRSRGTNRSNQALQKYFWKPKRNVKKLKFWISKNIERQLSCRFFHSRQFSAEWKFLHLKIEINLRYVSYLHFLSFFSVSKSKCL